MAQNGTKKGFNRKQLKVAEMLANPDYFNNHNQIIKICDVPRTTFYRWLRDEEFNQYVNSLVERYTDAELPDIWKSLISRCKAGDVQAIKLYFEMKGRYSQNLNVKGIASVQIINDIPKKKDDANDTSD